MRSRFLTALLVAGATSVAFAQRPPSAADGPWSGWAKCALTTIGTSYEETQTHTWRITGAMPGGTGSARLWPATWSVEGAGQRAVKTVKTGENKLPTTNIDAPPDTWTIRVPDVATEIAMWDSPATGEMRVGSQHAQLTAPGAYTIYASAGGQRTPPGTMGEYQFPYILTGVTSSTIKSDAPATKTLVIPIGFERPHDAKTIESCTWEFNKVAVGAETKGPTGGATGTIGTPAPDLPAPGAGRGTPNVPPSTGRGGTPAPSPAPGPTPPPAPPPGSTGTIPPPSLPPVSKTPPPATSPAPPPPPPPAPTTGTTGTIPPPSLPPVSKTPPPATSPVPPPPPPPPPPAGRGGRSGLPRPVPPSTSTGGAPSPAASGTYLVTITGIICGQPTKDSPFPGVDPDGKGDEIYAAAYVRKFDRTSLQLNEYTVRQTIPYGDVTNYSGARLQGGTQTPTGGVQAGDWLPGGSSTARTVPAQESVFPFRVWQGQLTDGADALVINPMVWEHDGGTGILSNWVQSQAVLNNTIALNPAVQARAASRTFGTLEVGATTPPGSNIITALINGQQDRPIGVRPNGGSYSIPNLVVVLTREIIEQALSSQWATIQPSTVPGQALTIPKPGILVINLSDTAFPSNVVGASSASYTLILQVEKIGG
jgi:hypothetical protein